MYLTGNQRAEDYGRYAISLESNTPKRPFAHQGYSDGETTAGSPSKVPWPVFLLLVGIIVPFILQLGPLRLSVYRFVLLLFTIPAIFLFFKGRAGKIRTPDVALFLFWAWSALSLMVIHSPDIWIESVGILFLETMGSYLIARVYIRNAAQFHATVLLSFRIIIFLLPFALYESLLGKNLLLDGANSLLPSLPDFSMEKRWGLDRAQGPFDHPILYGVFCGSLLSLVYMVLGYNYSWWRRVGQTTIVGLTAALALSSGPLSAMFAQILLLCWDGVFKLIRQRWIILSCIVFAFVVLIEVSANRSTPEIFISYFAFNASTAWNRIAIWIYGSASVLKHPFFGIGFNDWERPWYMVPSMDMFWLVPAVRHGIFVGLLQQLVFFSIFLAVIFKRKLSDRVSWYRTGFLICIMGYYLTGWTVHYWNATYVQFMFLLGSGIWILDTEEGVESFTKEGAAIKDRKEQLGYTRFKPQRSRREKS